MRRKSLIVSWNERINLEADDLGNISDIIFSPGSDAEGLEKVFNHVCDPTSVIPEDDWWEVDDSQQSGAEPQSRRDNSGGGIHTGTTNNSESSWSVLYKSTGRINRRRHSLLVTTSPNVKVALNVRTASSELRHEEEESGNNRNNRKESLKGKKKTRRDNKRNRKN